MANTPLVCINTSLSVPGPAKNNPAPTARLLNKFEPNKLPKIKPVSLRRAAAPTVTNSGKEVPKATIENPTNPPERLSVSIRSVEAPTTTWAAAIVPNKPAPARNQGLMERVLSEIAGGGVSSAVCKRTINTMKITNTANNTKPCPRVISLCTKAAKMSTPPNDKNPRDNVPAGTVIGRMNAATPKTKVKLATLEPTMLPKPRLDSPCKAAQVDTTNSGALVPKPRINAPITTVGTFIWCAKRDAPNTNWSAANANTAKPTNNTRTAMRN